MIESRKVTKKKSKTLKQTSDDLLTTQYEEVENSEM